MSEEQAKKMRELIRNAIIASESEAVGRATGLVLSGFFGKQQSLDDAKKEVYGFIESLMEERILSAAIQYRDTIFSVPAPGRHHNIAHAIGRMDLPFEAQRDQGFLTSKGRFVSRAEAWHIADVAGQILRQTGSHGTLFSEDVW